MKLTFLPIRHNLPLTMEKRGEALILNGIACDFSDVAEGEEHARESFESPFIAADVRRKNAVLHISILLPHAATAPKETLFPKTRSLRKDGPVPLPPYEAAMEAGSIPSD
jgi:hypothetical protein